LTQCRFIALALFAYLFIAMVYPEKF